MNIRSLALFCALAGTCVFTSSATTQAASPKATAGERRAEGRLRISVRKAMKPALVKAPEVARKEDVKPAGTILGKLTKADALTVCRRCSTVGISMSGICSATA